ncbi:hypothetical protein [Halalkalibacter alkalisediminis]|uniref:YfhD family protein n=1 Tax=Halalkalibacter alkalisediminis TaxID=935616 RepID=A0ABV6NAC1_9BACI|nr:hypothetical protein [Halalkalibacter alkalisediminis]
MSKKSRSKRVFQEGKDAVQPANETEMDTMTLGDLSLEKAERHQSKQSNKGSN